MLRHLNLVPPARRAVVFALCALTSNCTGHVVGNSGGGGLREGSGETLPGQDPAGPRAITPLPPAPACRTSSPGPRALRRLTAAEYSATLRDLLGDPNLPLTSVFS